VFLLRLALALGRTVRELQASLTEREMAEWFAFHQMEPIGGQRADWHAAIIAATVANANRGKGRPAAKAEDFLAFQWWKTPRHATGKADAGAALAGYLRSKKTLRDAPSGRSSG
jgi:hypothetical protein